MLEPTWLVDVLAGVMLATSTYCVTRLVAARLWGRTLNRDVNVAHVAMGVAMAGMLVTNLKTLPDGAWEVVFAALVVWFGTRAVRLVAQRTSGLDHHLSHNLTHMVMAGAMFYMFRETSSGVTSASATPSMSAMGGAGGTSNLAFLTLVLVVILFASAVWHADELTRYTTARRQLVRVGVGVAGPGGARVPSPRGTVLGFTALASSTERTVDEANAEQGHWLAPRLEMGCHIAMCITMGYMLVLML